MFRKFSDVAVQGLDFVRQLISLLRNHCESCTPALASEFDAIVDDDERHVGFIINERIINLPPQISPPSFDALWYVTVVMTDVIVSLLTFQTNCHCPDVECWHSIVTEYMCMAGTV